MQKIAQSGHTGHRGDRLLWLTGRYAVAQMVLVSNPASTVSYTTFIVNSVTRLGDFVISWQQIFLQKCLKFWRLLQLFSKMLPLSKNFCGFFLGNLRKFWGYFNIPSSGRTDRELQLQLYLHRD